MLLLNLFFTFLVIGSVSFGGGYAMLSVIEMEVTRHGWMTTQEFTDVVAVAGMSPGPIATNSAIFVGYQTAGLPGAVAAAAGMVLPSLIIVILVGAFFYKYHNNQLVKSAFYGLRPIITGLILYAAIRFAYSHQIIGSSLNWHVAGLLLIFAGSLFALMRLRTHPALVIVISGLVGIAAYG